MDLAPELQAALATCPEALATFAGLWLVARVLDRQLATLAVAVRALAPPRKRPITAARAAAGGSSSQTTE